MKCSPSNVFKLLNASNTGNANDINLGEDQQVVADIVRRIGQKKYKLSFILSAFGGMRNALEDESWEFEVDYDRVYEYLSQNDYWIESYEDYWDESDNFFNYIHSVASEDEIKETIISNFYDGSFSSSMSSLLEDCSGSDAENYNPDIIPVQTIVEGIEGDSFLGALISDIEDVKIVADHRRPSEYSKKYDINPKSFFSQKFYEKIRMPFNSRPSLSQEELETFFEHLIDYLAGVYADEVNNMNSDSQIIDVLKSSYEDSAKERWVRDNKEEWLKSEVENYGDNNAHEFHNENARMSRKYLGQDPAVPGVNHYVTKPITQRIANDRWIYFTGEDAATISIDESQPVSKLGVDEWIDIAESLKDHASNYEMHDRHDEFINIIERYSDAIKFVISSDPVLKEVFSEDSSIYSSYLDEGRITQQNEIVAEASSYMSPEDSQKLMRDFAGNSPERIRFIEEARERRREQDEQDRILRQRAQEQRQRELEEESKLLVEKESLRKKITEEKQKYLSNPELIYKDFGDDGVLIAKEMGLFDKGFNFKSFINLGKSFPGQHATHSVVSDAANHSSEIRYYSEILEPFNIVIHPKHSEKDPRGMNVVFDNGNRDGGINYHDRSLNRDQTPEGYYNFIGWVGGAIDWLNKTMYVTEIQSDVVQKTYRMRDFQASMSGLEQEKNKLTDEISSLSSKIESFDKNVYFENKIKELENKINSSSDEQMKKRLNVAIDAIRNQMVSGIDPTQQDKQKLEKLKANLVEIEKQISSISDRKSEDKAPQLNRPHLSQFKSRIENRFEDWLEIFYNEIFRYCKNLEIKTFYLVGASTLHKLWTGWSTQETFEMFKKVYDDQAMKHQMEKVKFHNSVWWKLDLGNRMPKYAKSWYKTIKLAQNDFSSVNISDLIDQFRRGSISQSDLEQKIRERYAEFIKSGPVNKNIYVEKLKAFFKTHFQIMGENAEFDSADDDYAKLERIRSAISAFMSTTGKEYMDENGEDLKEPFKSILHRFLIQNYNYDLELDELID